MKVILQKDVQGLGDAGEVKEVADGYARNFQLKKKMVIVAYGGSAKAVEHQKKISTMKMEKRNKAMAQVGEQLKGLGAIEVPVRVGAKYKLFGSVTSMDISNALKAKGHEIDKRKIEMADKIRNLGNYTVKVRLAEKIVVPLSISVISDGSAPVEEEHELLVETQTNAAPAAEETAEG